MAESGVSEGRSPYRDSGPVAMEGDSLVFPIQPLVSAMPWAEWIVGALFARVSPKPMVTQAIRTILLANATTVVWVPRHALREYFLISDLLISV